MTPLAHNLFVAYNYETLLLWCRQHEVNPNTIRYWSSLRDARGLFDYSLIFLSDWYNSNIHDRGLLDQTLRGAINVIYADEKDPIVYNGRIIGWKEKINEPEVLAG